VTIALERGKHSFPEEGMCLMEAVAFIAGEDFTDRPECVSPILASFGRTLNDVLPDKQRQQLAPLVPLLVGTVNPEQDQQDGLRCAHWLFTHWLPTWIDLISELEEHSTALRELPVPSSWSDVEGWFATWVNIRFSTWAAVRSGTKSFVSGDALWGTVWDVSRATYRVSAVWGVEGGIAVWDNVWDTVWATDWAARGDAKLQPTVDKLRQDAINLFTELVEGRHK
jgi:hypothetical protein